MGVCGLVIRDARFEVSAVGEKQYPNNDIPEVVLVGKSNVGKSSFINAMVNRKNLARTSSEPGKTRQINFYNIDDKLYFVDLPGYGFSKMSKQEQVKVGGFIEHYLSTRKQIALIVFLIDIRHSPTENDVMMYDFIINTGFPCLILANKADKIAPTKVDATVKKLKNELNPLKDLKFLPFSSEKKIYSETVWNEIQLHIN